MPSANLPGGVLVHLSPRGRLERPELVLAPGPAEIATTGAGTLADLYGYTWALVWDNNTPTLRLFRLDGGAWGERTPASPLPELTSPARHIALAFDRSARPMIAWQALDGIRVRQWDPSGAEYIVRGPFAGQDPGLVFDGLPAQVVGGADVVLYYLSDDRRQVHARLERDLYGAEHDVATLGRADLYLDQVVRLPYRVRLELATDQPNAAGNLERVRLTSDPYPLQVADGAAVALNARGAYPETLVKDASDDAAAVALTARGAYRSDLHIQQFAEPVAATLGARGEYLSNLYVQSLAEPVAVALDGRGEYNESIVQHADTDGVAATLDARGEYTEA